MFGRMSEKEKIEKGIRSNIIYHLITQGYDGEDLVRNARMAMSFVMGEESATCGTQCCDSCPLTDKPFPDSASDKEKEQPSLGAIRPIVAKKGLKK